MIDAAVRDLVRERARERCEYCRLPQHADEATFHIEHIFAQQHVPPGADEPDNLALACHRCNLHKGNKPQQLRSGDRRSRSAISSATGRMASALRAARRPDCRPDADGSRNRRLASIQFSPPARIPRGSDCRRRLRRVGSARCRLPLRRSTRLISSR